MPGRPPPYSYATRTRGAHIFHLDYNEYWGRIHPELAHRFEVENFTRQYAMSSPRSILDSLGEVTGWSAAAPSWATHGADEALLHSLLAARLQFPPQHPTQSYVPSWATTWSPSYEHASTFAAQLGLQMFKDFREAEIVYHCTPNNPTGDFTGDAVSFESFEDQLGSQDSAKWLVLDLTYEDYMPSSAREAQAQWVAERLRSNRPTVAVKSFAKCLPIAGFRFGLMATNIPIVQEHFDRVYNRKLVTEAALYVLQHGLDHRAFYAVERQSIFDVRQELHRGLSALAWSYGVQLQIPPGGNFILGHANDLQLGAFHKALQQVGISTRLKSTDQGQSLLRITSVGESYLPEIFQRVREAREAESTPPVLIY
ncbi:MAG TPA: aminotransferase class I/II-fold pyridoxal phosphate-dependent enzyme [Pseudobdellovibrionaceae bacterium]|nr:aminotransferase class I/II-fold pyridoxal phosphate-dependent enzyme [Pseudobdellovibrionaceae bacterium]